MKVTRAGWLMGTMAMGIAGSAGCLRGGGSDDVEAVTSVESAPVELSVQRM